MLPDWMVRKSKPQPTLIQQMFGESVLLHCALVKFYVDNGFKVEKIHRFVEFEGSRAFAKFHDVLYQLRVDATIEKNEAKATGVKLVGNSSYGKHIQNPYHFTSTSICNKEIKRQKSKKPTFLDAEEHSPTLFEVKELPTTVTEKYPLQIGNTILDLSKVWGQNFFF